MIMKKIKRLFAFGLALIMCLGMAVTASAAEGKITVQGAINGVQYSAFKIFDATISGTDSMAYKTTATNDEFMKQQAGVTEGATSGTIKEGNDVLFTVVDNGGETYVNVGNPEKAAAWVQANINSLKPATTSYMATATNKKAEFSGLDYGYYYVIGETETGGSAVMLTSVNGEMTINEKHGTPGFGEDPDSGKNASKETVQIGETITYTVNYKNALNYDNGKLILKYTIEDNLADGIELVPDTLKVYVTGNGSITGVTPISFTNTSTTGGIEGEITWATSTDANDKTDDVLNYPNAPSVITVVYDVLVTKDFKAGNEGVTNTVKIGYVTEKPDGDNTPDPDPEEETKTVYTGKVDITKVVRNSDGINTNQPLKDAEFIIRKTETVGETTVVKYMKKTTETVDGKEKVVISWADSAEDQDIYKVTTDENGKAEFVGLAAGTYELVETKAPAGYNLLADGIEFTIGITEVSNESNGEVTVTVDMEEDQTVGNSAGSLLPSTGGIGTTIFYVVGGVLVAGAGILLITKKRMKKEQ